MRVRQSTPRQPRDRSGFTLIELLVAIAIIGVLISLALPAVQNAREAARRTQCKSQLRQYGEALHNFESSFQTLPEGLDFANGNRHSWCTRILPYLEQAPLYNRYNWSKPWNDTTGPTGQSNNDVTQTNLSIFKCPSESFEQNGAIDYGGNFGTSLTGMVVGYGQNDGWEAGTLIPINAPLIPNPQRTAVKLGQVSDGLSQTFLVFECSGREAEAGLWGSGTNGVAMEHSINDDVSLTEETIISKHSGGGHALFADGHVVFLSNSTDLQTLAKMATRSRSETVSADF